MQDRRVLYLMKNFFLVWFWHMLHFVYSMELGFCDIPCIISKHLNNDRCASINIIFIYKQNINVLWNKWKTCLTMWKHVVGLIQNSMSKPDFFYRILLFSKVDAYLGLPQHLGKSSFSLVNDFQLLTNVIKDSILDAKKQQLRRITFNNNFRRIPCTCSFSRVQITIET